MQFFDTLSYLIQHIILYPFISSIGHLLYLMRYQPLITGSAFYAVAFAIFR